MNLNEDRSLFDNFGLPEFRLSSRAASSGNAWSDHYGAVSLACEYADYPMTLDFFVAFWQHGCFGPWEKAIPGRILYNNENRFRGWRVFVARADEEQYLRSQGFKRARAIGLPFVYVKARNQLRCKKSLLILPTHSLTGFSVPDRNLFHVYVREVVAFRRKFDRVVACVHPSCFENGFWVDEFREHGIPVIRGADSRDANALLRMKTLFSKFDYVTTNGWGSHVAYALSCGAKLSIFGTFPDFSAENYMRCDQTWQNHERRLIEVSLGPVVSERDRFLAKFHRPPMEGVQDVEMGNWLIGQENKVSPYSMRSILRQAFGHSFVSRLRVLLEASRRSLLKRTR